jgi:iron complex transport system permease protein
LQPPLRTSLAALLLVVVLAAGIGSVAIPPARVVEVLGDGVAALLRGEPSVPGELDGRRSVEATIVWQLRLPRVLLAALVGMSLGLAGAAFQGVFRNPLADPYLLGAASGAGLGAAGAMVFGLTLLWGPVAVPIAAFGGAAATVVTVVSLARRGLTLPIVPLILAGVVVGSLLAAATSFVMLMAREQAAGVLTWLLGSMAFASWSRVATVAPVIFSSLLLLQLAARGLDVLQLGERSAAQLGVPVEALKWGVVAVATLVTAVAVSVAGVIGFVGLLVPHAVRLLFGPGHRRLLPLSAIWGALFLVAADLLARTLIAPSELPVGVVTALLGAPFFLALLRRKVIE